MSDELGVPKQIELHSQTGGEDFAAYTIKLADLLTTQLSRFVTLNAHQLAGHVASLEFWSQEVAHCLEVIDKYSARFELLKQAQQAHVKEHQTAEFDLSDIYGTSARPPRRPRPISHRDRTDARSKLCEAFYRLLIRCHSSGLIDEGSVRKQCDRHGISIDPQDLNRQSQ